MEAKVNLSGLTEGLELVILLNQQQGRHSSVALLASSPSTTPESSTTKPWSLATSRPRAPNKKPLFLNLGMTLVQEGSTLWRYWELVGLLVEEVAQRVIPEENNWSQKGRPACNSPALDLGTKANSPTFPLLEDGPPSLISLDIVNL